MTLLRAGTGDSPRCATNAIRTPSRAPARLPPHTVLYVCTAERGAAGGPEREHEREQRGMASRGAGGVHVRTTP